ncbi:MAG: hypothetical protein AB1695_07815 [Stygiobacter sp.]|uniref:Uncharacterized protein n=1 Tax=Stygiobacter electus TaxID=3032292 RepID=A0AAE3TCU4_9BACT|nr:hypothetical protein [Stygiobacter electus]MDF1612778.1 hypothetical protein [Stygiobacter electus]
MKFLIKIIFILFLFQISFLIAQEKEKPIIHSVVIMPFDDYQEYPYNLDYIRQSLEIGFLQKGFNVVTSDSVWEIILDRDLRLTNLNTSDVEEIANDIKVDLIVFGKATDYATYRQSGIYSMKIVNKPILIKVFDVKKKEIILFERLTLNQNWGLFDQSISYENFGSTIAQQIKNMGY